MTKEQVGKRVRVYWAEEEAWFEGVIRDYDESQGVYVVYDDGDERWELHDQTMLVEGEDDDERHRTNDRDRAPEMMEPPVSPGSNCDEEYEEIEQSERHQRDDSSERKVENELHDLPHQNAFFDDVDDRDDGEDNEQQEERSEHQDTDLLANKGEDDAHDDSEQSVAESDMPQTLDKIASRLLVKEQSSKHALASVRPIPFRGFLKGRVLRATGLETSRALAPNAFVRISFVKSGDSTQASVMLRCKETISSTDIVQGSRNPVWSDNPLTNVDEDNNCPRDDRASGEFQLELLPQIVPPATEPAWDQLPGDVIFTVFSALSVDASSRNGTNEYIGQAIVSLRVLLQDLLTGSPFTVQILELRSRSGKRLGMGNVSTRSLGGDDRIEAPTLVISFEFIPTYQGNVKEQKVPRSSSIASSTSRRPTGIAWTQAALQPSARQSKARSTKALAPAKKSSSLINRRRFEKQVANDNRSFAKRLEWKEARWTRQAAQARNQERKKVTPSQYGARKHGHKASSAINRTKYVHQVAAENKAMSRRLQHILKNDESARSPGRFRSWTAEPKNSSNYDYVDRDKMYALDKRQERQVELDYLMEKAQNKYQQQHQLVENVTELQEEVAALKCQADTLSKNVLRLDIFNKKKKHVRDCLLRAASASGSSIGKAHATLVCKDESASKRHKDEEREWELLTQHRERLQTDKQELSLKLKALYEQEVDLDNEINDQQSKWKLLTASKKKKKTVRGQKQLRR